MSADRPFLRHREPFSVLAVLGVVVAAFWLTVGVACVMSVWDRSPGWCLVGLALYLSRWLTWRR